MAELVTKGPAAAWTASVSRVELAGKLLKAAINLWDECGSAPKLEELAWNTAEAARAAMTHAQDAERGAFKKLKSAQSQLQLEGTRTEEPTEPVVAESLDQIGLEDPSNGHQSDEAAPAMSGVTEDRR